MRKKDWEDNIAEPNYDKLEQDAIVYIQRTSFLNIGKVDNLSKLLKLPRLEYDRKAMAEFLNIRHVLIHRNGMRRDDQEIEITYELLSELIRLSHSLVCALRSSVYKASERDCVDEQEDMESDVAAFGGERAVFEKEMLQRRLEVVREELANYPVLPLLP